MQSKEETGKLQNILLYLLELQLLLSFKSLIRTVMTIMNIIFIMSKVEFLFPMVISPKFRTRQHRDKDHQEDAAHFKRQKLFSPGGKMAISQVVIPKWQFEMTPNQLVKSVYILLPLPARDISPTCQKYTNWDHLISPSSPPTSQLIVLFQIKFQKSFSRELSEIHMVQYWDDYHRRDAPHFSLFGCVHQPWRK